MGKLKQLQFKYVAAILLAVAISASVFIFQDEIKKLESLGYLGVFLISMLGNATMILPAPSLALIFALGGVLTSPLLVGLVAGLGSTFGELTGFLAGYGGSGMVEKNKVYKKVETTINKHGLWVIFVLAIIPNPLFDVAGLVAGATGIKLWKFFVVTLAGKTIKTIIFAYAGNFSLHTLS